MTLKIQISILFVVLSIFLQPFRYNSIAKEINSNSKASCCKNSEQKSCCGMDDCNQAQICCCVINYLLIDGFAFEFLKPTVYLEHQISYLEKTDFHYLDQCFHPPQV